jgi:hypothetical protein
MILLVVYVVSGCQMWQCAELKEGVCAEWDEKVVKVNTKKCPNGKFCYLLGLELEKSWNVGGQTLCEDLEMDLSTEAINCGAAKKGVKYGTQHPIRCKVDDECVMVNGKSKSCVCAMDGKAYCELAEDDPELVIYNSYCFLFSKREAFAWYLYIDLFPVLHGVPDCVEHLFEELKILKQHSELLDIDKSKMFLSEQDL